MQTNSQIIALPANDKAAVYVRTAQVMSQSGQTLMNRLSNHNIDVLVAVARQYGFQPENIIVYEDNGVSGTTAISEREALRALVATIELDEVKTVFLLSENSLSRDASFIDLNFIIELCRRHSVYVVTLTQVYDFKNPMHVRLFRFVLEAESFVTRARTTAGRRFRKWQAVQSDIHMPVGRSSLKDTSTQPSSPHTHTVE